MFFFDGCTFALPLYTRYNITRHILSPLSQKYLHTTKKCDKDTIPPFDCYVIGSDQLWSLHCTKETDKVYWGQFIRPFHSRVVGYAISSTQDSLYQMGETLIRHCLEAFSSLSFREEIIGKLIYDMVGVKGETVLDPTLLLPFDYWNGFGSVEEKGCQW